MRRASPRDTQRWALEERRERRRGGGGGGRGRGEEGGREAQRERGPDVTEGTRCHSQQPCCLCSRADTRPHTPGQVAWALEGIANAYQKSGDLRKAHQVWEEVIRIREKLQQEGDGKQLFSKELVKASEAVAKVEAARAAARVKFQQRVGMVAGAARGVKAILGGGGLSPSGSQGSMSELVSSETISPSKGGGLHELRRPLLGQVAREGAGAASGQDLRERGGEAGRLVSDAQGM